MAPTLTQDYLVQFGDNGVLLNTDANPSAGFVDLTSIQGLDNSPYRMTQHEREHTHGGFLTAEFESIRWVTLIGNIIAPTTLLYTYLDTLKGNYAAAKLPQPLYFTTVGMAQRLVFAKSLGLKYDLTDTARYGMIPFQVQLGCEDPSIYSDPAITASGSLAGTAGGRGYPESFPISYGVNANQSAGAVAATNMGNKETDATITVYGPVVNPAVVLDQTSAALYFNITLASTDSLVINLRSRTVLLNGTANRRGTLSSTSQWFMLQPGTNNILFLGTAGSGGTPSMSVSYRSAYH
jgi:Phage tail protein